MAVITISFKASEKELYNFLKSQVSPSIYIKELLYKEINNKNNFNKINNNSNNLNVDINMHNNSNNLSYKIYEPDSSDTGEFTFD